MPDGSLASRGRLNEPWGIAVDAGAIYFAEDVPGAEQGAIRRVGLEDGRVSTLRTDIATDSAVVGMLGNTLVVNESLADPVRVDVTTGERHTLFPTTNGRRGEFRAVATDGVSVVLLRRRHSIWRLDRNDLSPLHIAGRDADGTPRGSVGGDDGPATQADLGFVEDAVLAPDGHVYISHSGVRTDGFRIRRVDAVSGIITTVVGPGTVVEGEHAGTPRVRPGPMTMMPDGSLVFADRAVRLLRYDPKTSRVTVVAGGPRGRGGDGGSVRFERIWDLAASPDGGLLVFDYGANRIRHLHPNGDVRTIAGNDDRLYGHSRWQIEWVTAPPPDNELCTNRMDRPAVTVMPSNDDGEPVDGVLVRLYRVSDFEAPVVHEPRPVASGAAVDGGRVTLEAPTSDDYIAVAAFPGFTPVSRSVTLSAGCRGELPLLMRPVTGPTP